MDENFGTDLADTDYTGAIPRHQPMTGADLLSDSAVLCMPAMRTMWDEAPDSVPSQRATPAMPTMTAPNLDVESPQPATLAPAPPGCGTTER